MIRQPDSERHARLSITTLDQIFIKRAQQGLSCSLFEAEALTEFVRDLCLKSSCVEMVNQAQHHLLRQSLRSCRQLTVILLMHIDGAEAV